MLHNKLEIKIIKIQKSNATEKDLNDAKNNGFNNLITHLPKSVLYQDILTLEIPEMNFDDLDDVIKQGGHKEKIPYTHEYQVLKWEYYPRIKKAQVFVYDDLDNG